MSWGEQRSWGDCATDPLHGAICTRLRGGHHPGRGAGQLGDRRRQLRAGRVSRGPQRLGPRRLRRRSGRPGRLQVRPRPVRQRMRRHVRVLQQSRPVGRHHRAGRERLLELGRRRLEDVVRDEHGDAARRGHRSAHGRRGTRPHAGRGARAILLSSGECPNGQAADADGTAGCAGQGTWRDDPDGIPEPMGHALRAAQAAAAAHEPGAAIGADPAATATTTSIDLSWTAPTDDGGSRPDRLRGIPTRRCGRSTGPRSPLSGPTTLALFGHERRRRRDAGTTASSPATPRARSAVERGERNGSGRASARPGPAIGPDRLSASATESTIEL